MPKNEGIQATAVGTQIAKEATQQAVGKQSNSEAGRDVVITEQELAATGETVNIDQTIPPWVLVALVLGWIAPSPNEIVRGFYNLIAVLRGKENGNQRYNGPATQVAGRKPNCTCERPRSKDG
jgi:hypothetical protein